MKTPLATFKLLAAASLALSVMAAGCGDDTVTGGDDISIARDLTVQTNVDMSVIADLTPPGPDLAPCVPNTQDTRLAIINDSCTSSTQVSKTPNLPMVINGVLPQLP